MKKLSKGINKFDKVKINWIDIVQNSGWTNLEEIETKEPVSAASVGFFILENNSKVIIVDSIVDIDDRNDGSYTVFPKGCILSIVKLVEE